MDPATILAGLAAGAAIGLILGLVGGGGSILAVPLLIYVVGVQSTHAAIGTAAVAVSINALTSLAGHARVVGLGGAACELRSAALTSRAVFFVYFYRGHSDFCI